MTQQTPQNKLTLANLLTSLRFVFAPALIWLAWHGYSDLFLWLLAFTFLTDVLDGMAARMLNQQSEFGALLDSAADILIYAIMSVSIWWLWPEIVEREKLFILLAIASYLTPVLIGFIKFHALTAYHTILVKLAVLCIGSAFFILFIFDIAWPFQLAVIISLLAAIEEIAITLYLTEIRSDIQSLWHLIYKTNK
jgi:CDP-diacylglycerol--glycerol-3-phosphate 3-phosphatidyltransferase